MQIRTNGFGFLRTRQVDARQAPWVAPVVFGVFLICGLAAFLGGIYLWNKAEATRLWPSVQGVVVSSQVLTHHSRSSSSGTSTTYGAEVVYKYSFKGEEYRSNKMGSMSFSSSDYSLADRTVRRYAPGTPIKVFINVANPSESLLTPGAGWGEILFILMGLVFAVIAIGGFFWMFTQKQDHQKECETGTDSDRLSQL